MRKQPDEMSGPLKSWLDETCVWPDIVQIPAVSSIPDAWEKFLVLSSPS